MATAVLSLQNLVEELYNAVKEGYVSISTESLATNLLTGVTYVGLSLLWSPGRPDAAVLVQIGNLATAGLPAIHTHSMAVAALGWQCMLTRNVCMATGLEPDAQLAVQSGSQIVMAVPLVTGAPGGAQGAPAQGPVSICGALVLGFDAPDRLTNTACVAAISQLATLLTPYLPSLLYDFLPQLMLEGETDHKPTPQHPNTTTQLQTTHQIYPQECATTVRVASCTHDTSSLQQDKPAHNGTAQNSIDYNVDDGVAMHDGPEDSLTDASWKVPPARDPGGAPDRAPGAPARSASTPVTVHGTHRDQHTVHAGPQGSTAAPARGPSEQVPAQSRSLPQGKSAKWFEARARLLQEMAVHENPENGSEDLQEPQANSIRQQQPKPTRLFSGLLSFLRPHSTTPSNTKTHLRNTPHTSPHTPSKGAHTSDTFARESGATSSSGSGSLPRRAGSGSFSFGFAARSVLLEVPGEETPCQEASFSTGQHAMAANAAAPVSPRGSGASSRWSPRAWERLSDAGSRESSLTYSQPFSLPVRPFADVVQQPSEQLPCVDESLAYENTSYEPNSSNIGVYSSEVYENQEQGQGLRYVPHAALCKDSVVDGTYGDCTPFAALADVDLMAGPTQGPSQGPSKEPLESFHGSAQNSAGQCIVQRNQSIGPKRSQAALALPPHGTIYRTATYALLLSAVVSFVASVRGGCVWQHWASAAYLGLATLVLFFAMPRASARRV